MKSTATAPVTVGLGALVKLTAKQLARMQGLVKPSEERKGWHEVIVPAVQFKTGEVYEMDSVDPEPVAIDEKK